VNRRHCTRPGCTDRVVGRKLCRRHYQQAWKAGEFVNAPLPPRVPGRTVCAADHKHAESSTCYIQHQCRCVPCQEHHSQMTSRRNRLKAYGRFDTGLVDAEPVREHMMLLGEFGLGYKRVASLAGIGVTAGRTLIWGRQETGPRYGELQKRVKRETAEAILSVKPDISNLAGRAPVPARGTHRRIQALVAMGWSQSKLADRLGMEISNFQTMLYKQQAVSAGRHRQVEALFNQLWNMAPAHDAWHDKAAYSRTLNFAKAHRWLPPMAWDDIDNDVEPPVPEGEQGAVDEMAVELALMGERVRLSSAERREAVTRAHAKRWSDSHTAEMLGCNERTVLRIRQELELQAFGQAELVQERAS